LVAAGYIEKVDVEIVVVVVVDVEIIKVVMADTTV